MNNKSNYNLSFQAAETMVARGISTIYRWMYRDTHTMYPVSVRHFKNKQLDELKNDNTRQTLEAFCGAQYEKNNKLSVSMILVMLLQGLYKEVNLALFDRGISLNLLKIIQGRICIQRFEFI